MLAGIEGMSGEMKFINFAQAIAIASMRSLPRIRGHGRLGHLINSRLESDGSSPLPAEKSNKA